MALSEKLGLQKVFDIRICDPDDNSILKAEMTKLTESTFTNGQEQVTLSGGGANAPLIVFDHSKSAMISGASAFIQGDLAALQTGTDVETLSNTTEFRHYETLAISSDTATTTYTPTGTSGSEVGHVYILDAKGNRETELSQAVAASSTEFALSGKTITFNTGDYADNTKVLVGYFPTASEAKKLVNDTNVFSYTGEIFAKARFKDCNNDTLIGQIHMKKGHISGAFELTTTSGGEASTHNFEITALEGGCNDTELWDIIWLDPDNLT